MNLTIRDRRARMLSLLLTVVLLLSLSTPAMALAPGTSDSAQMRREAVGETREDDAADCQAGHTWDENHVCTVCGVQGKDISTLPMTNVGDTYLYTHEGANVRPTPVLTDGDKTLELKSTPDGADGYITWENCWKIGTARVVVHGNGDYYGSVEKSYRIVPKTVPDVKVGKVTATTAELSWSAVPGATQYVVSKFDYGTKTLRELAVTDGPATSIILGGLNPDTTYSVCVRGRAVVDGENYDSYNYTWLYPRTLSADSSAGQLTDVAVTVSDAETLHLQTVDGRDYLFLPSFADLKALPMAFTVSGEAETIRLTGSRGSTEISGTRDTVDLTAISDKNEESCYVLGVSVDGLSETPLYVMHASVPALFLHSQDPAAKGRSFIDASKENQTEGSMLLLRADGSEVYNGALTQIKARGNTTFTNSPKKAYQIKLDKKTDLIGIAGKGKTWVLLAGYTDATQLHDKSLKDIAAALGMPYVPRNDWVDLYYDGEYRGIYLLGEKNSIGSSAIDITDMEDAYEEINDGYGDDAEALLGENRFGQEFSYIGGLQEPDDVTGGYLIELNNTQYDEICGFKTAQGVGMNLKSPEFAGEAAVRYISEYYQEFENAVYAQDADGNYTGRNPDTGKYYYDYVDLQSLVQMYLIQEFGANVDGFYSSFYFYKDAGGMMYAGPIWDQDSTFGTGWAGVIRSDNLFTTTRYLAKALVQIPSFREAVAAYYREHFRAEAASLIGDDGKVAQHVAEIGDSVAMNYKLWPFVRVGNPNKENHLWGKGTDYPAVIRDLQRWIAERLDVLDAKYPEGADPTQPTQPATPTQPDNPSQPTNPSEPVKPSEPTVPDEPSVPTPVTLPYVDVEPDAYYYDAVAWAHTRGVTVGTSPETFSPAAGCSRAQIVTFLWRAAGSPEPGAAQKAFSDVQPGGYYEKAVAWAVAEGITVGTSETTFSPDAPATRAQAVTFLYRFAKAQPVSDAVPFADVEQGAYYADAVAWAYVSDIVKGTSATTFEPDAKCLRESIVTLLFRYFQ